MSDSPAKIVHCQDVSKTCFELAARGFRVFSISEPKDASDFFSCVKETFPLDPPISGAVHWDAFSDSISGGLDALSETKIALCIRDATAFRQTHESDFVVAMECLLEAAREVQALKREDGKDEAEIVVLVGFDSPIVAKPQS